jgi:hypothetical protein
VSNFKIDERTNPVTDALSGAYFVVLPSGGDADKRLGLSGQDIFGRIRSLLSLTTPQRPGLSEAGGVKKDSACSTQEFKLIRPYRILRGSGVSAKAFFRPSLVCTVASDIVNHVNVADTKVPSKNAAAALLASEYEGLSFEVASLGGVLRHSVDRESAEELQDLLIGELKSWFPIPVK